MARLRRRLGKDTLLRCCEGGGFWLGGGILGGEGGGRRGGGTSPRQPPRATGLRPKKKYVQNGRGCCWSRTEPRPSPPSREAGKRDLGLGRGRAGGGGGGPLASSFERLPAAPRFRRAVGHSGPEDMWNGFPQDREASADAWKCFPRHRKARLAVNRDESELQFC